MTLLPDQFTRTNGVFHEKLRTALDPIVRACVDVPGAEHDLRPYTYVQYNQRKVSLVCIWCGGVACGEYSHPDPCIKIYHHSGNHKSRSGESWPLGGSRPEPVEP